MLYSHRDTARRLSSRRCHLKYYSDSCHSCRQPSDGGDYDCVVTDFQGCAETSEVALLTVIAACPADLDGDGLVNITDLLTLLAAWGPC